VSNSRSAGSAGFLDLRREFSNPANRTQTLHAGRIDQGQAGRVIASIFELAQTFKKD